MHLYNPYSIVNETNVAKTNAEGNGYCFHRSSAELVKTGVFRCVELVELIGIEPTTLCLQSRCSPS